MDNIQICRTVYVCVENIVHIFAVPQKVLITPTSLLLSSNTKRVATCCSNHIQNLVSPVLNSDGERTFSQ
jgi:uncharacterized Fe-S cluster protein YjdI